MKGQMVTVHKLTPQHCYTVGLVTAGAYSCKKLFPNNTKKSLLVNLL